MRIRRLAARYDYALIILDGMMPGERRTRHPALSMDRETGPAVILHSVIGEDIRLDRGVEMRAYDYVLKTRQSARAARPHPFAAALQPGRPRRADRAADPRLPSLCRLAAGSVRPASFRDPDEGSSTCPTASSACCSPWSSGRAGVLTRDMLLDLSRGP